MRGECPLEGLYFTDGGHEKPLAKGTRDCRTN